MDKNKKNKALIMLLSIISAFGALYYIKILSNSQTVYSTIYGLGITLLYYLLWKKMLNEDRIKKREIFTLLVFSYLFSFSLIYGNELRGNDENASIKFSLLKSFIIIFSIIPFVLLIYKYCKKISSTNSSKKEYDKKTLLICFSIVCVCYLIVWLAMWPGMFGLDAPVFAAMIEEHNIISQWTIAYQLFTYFFIFLGKNVFKNIQLGFSIQTLLQNIFVLYAEYNIMKYVLEKKGKITLFLTTLFFMLNLPLMFITNSSAQDSPFMVCVAMNMLFLLKMTMDTNTFFQTRKNVFGLFVWQFLLFVVRNNGLYSMIFTIIFILIFAIKRKDKRLFIALATIFIAIITFKIYNTIIFKALNIKDVSSLREKMSVPSVQIVATWNNKKNQMDESELEELYKFIPKEELEKYNNYFMDSRISDNSKKILNVDYINSNKIEFLNFYIKLLFKFPKDFAKAFLELTYGLWYTDIHYYDAKMYHPLVDYEPYSKEHLISCLGDKDNIINIDRDSKIPILDNILSTYYEDGMNFGNSSWNMKFSDTFIISVFSKIGIYFWIIIFLTTFAINNRRKSSTIILLFVWNFILVLMLGPVVLYRYYAPIIISMPLIILSIFIKNNQIKDTKLIQEGDSQNG